MGGKLMANIFLSHSSKVELQVVEENDNMNNRMMVTDADGRGERRMLRKSVSQKQRDG